MSLEYALNLNNVLKDMTNEFDILLYTFLTHENISQQTLCEKILEQMNHSLGKVEKKVKK